MNITKIISAVLIAAGTVVGFIGGSTETEMTGLVVAILGVTALIYNYIKKEK